MEVGECFVSKLEVAICFGGTGFGVQRGISVDSLHALEGIVRLLNVQSGVVPCDSVVVRIESNSLLFVGIVVIRGLVPSFDFLFRP